MKVDAAGRGNMNAEHGRVVLRGTFMGLSVTQLGWSTGIKEGTLYIFPLIVFSRATLAWATHFSCALCLFGGFLNVFFHCQYCEVIQPGKGKNVLFN